MGDIQIVDRLPSVEVYQSLRMAVGWRRIDDGAVSKALSASLYAVCAVGADGAVVGCARVIGDGIYLYIQDVMVAPAFQGRGVGRRLMDAVMAHVRGVAPENALFALMAAEGTAGFYEKYGFTPRPDGAPGMFQYQPNAGIHCI
jgi:ribosomal protein S18 acetylase RimI-like enzyme